MPRSAKAIGLLAASALVLLLFQNIFSRGGNATESLAESPGPIKGMTANPAFQWWRDPVHPQPDGWYGTRQTAETLGAQIDLLRQLGVRSYRIEFPWSLIAPNRPGGKSYSSSAAQDPACSCYNWARTDLIVNLLGKAHIGVLPMVVYTPPWATSAISSIAESPPASARYYADFMTALVKRYHKEIHEWEVWNEPDIPTHTWSGSLGDWVRLILKPGYQAVRAADPHATVVLGGLAYATTMGALYDAGAKGFFDVANVHAYPSGSQDNADGGSYTAQVQDAVTTVRTAMSQNGDGGKPLWVTEVGIPTQDTDPASGVANTSPAGQANFISDLYANLRGVSRIYWYQLADTDVYTSLTTILKHTYWGIVSHDLHHRKPGFAAYQSAL